MTKFCCFIYGKVGKRELFVEAEDLWSATKTARATLKKGETVTCYKVTQEDIDRGYIERTADF